MSLEVDKETRCRVIMNNGVNKHLGSSINIFLYTNYFITLSLSGIQGS